MRSLRSAVVLFRIQTWKVITKIISCGVVASISENRRFQR